MGDGEYQMGSEEGLASGSSDFWELLKRERKGVMKSVLTVFKLQCGETEC